MSLVSQREVPDVPASGNQLPPQQTTTNANSPNAQQASANGGIQLPPQVLAELAARKSWQQAVIGSLNVATKILAVRLILLLAVVGAIALTLIAVQKNDPARLIALGVYTVTVVLPMVWLSVRA